MECHLQVVQTLLTGGVQHLLDSDHCVQQDYRVDQYEKEWEPYVHYLLHTTCILMQMQEDCCDVGCKENQCHHCTSNIYTCHAAYRFLPSYSHQKLSYGPVAPAEDPVRLYVEEIGARGQYQYHHGIEFSQVLVDAYDDQEEALEEEKGRKNEEESHSGPFVDLDDNYGPEDYLERLKYDHLIECLQVFILV